MLSDMEIIKEYTEGQRQGITINNDCFFIPVRITGLGKTLRVDEKATIDNVKSALNIDDENISLEKIKELAKEKNIDISDYVKLYELDRRPEEFATPEALEAYNGLPIIKEHPSIDGVKDFLNFKNIKNNVIIGSVVKAFLKDKSVWGVAKVYDLKLLDSLDKLKSTSPAVYGMQIETENGLIEIPKHFNHLAFVEAGHWDVKGDNGYDISELHFNLKGEPVAEVTKDEKTVEDKVEDLVEAEAKEAEAFNELANVHKEIKKDEDEKMVSEKIDNEVIKENLDNEVIEEAKEKKKVDDDTLAVENVDEENKDTKDEVETKETKKEEKEVDEDEKVDSEECNNLDDERNKLLQKFRTAIDTADNSLNLKMPYIEGRLTPSAVITKILKTNYKLVDSKYQDLIFDKSNSRGMKNYALLVDSFNDLLANIEAKTNEAIKTRSVKAGRGHWEQTSNPNVKIDKNF